MIDTVSLFFTKDLLFSYEPIHLILGASIGIVAVIVLVKKAINKTRNEESSKN